MAKRPLLAETQTKLRVWAMLTQLYHPPGFLVRMGWLRMPQKILLQNNRQAKKRCGRISLISEGYDPASKDFLRRVPKAIA
jgi:hypothetical protein